MEETWYTVKEAAERTGLTVPTLRYYDKLGLMPQLHRNAAGVRQFTEQDICWVELICCLKNSRMPLQEIREFMELCLKEDACEERREILEKHRAFILEQMEQLKCSLGTIEYKLEHYREIGVFHIGGREKKEEEITRN